MRVACDADRPGLNKMHTVREFEDTPEVCGMIRKLPHMVEVLEG